jgi:hypothetical protein
MNFSGRKEVVARLGVEFLDSHRKLGWEAESALIITGEKLNY